MIRELPEHVKAGPVVLDDIMTYRLSLEDVPKATILLKKMAVLKESLISGNLLPIHL